MRCWYKVTAILLSLMANHASAESALQGGGREQEIRANGVWSDPATGLVWAGKDNGKDVNWHDAVKYCRNLRLDGSSDWRLPTLAELEGVYDRNVDSPGRAGPGKGRDFRWHVKGDLFLTGVQWSISQRVDDRGHPNGLAWYCDFANGVKNNDDTSRFGGRFANFGRRALCVRGAHQ